MRRGGGGFKTEGNIVKTNTPLTLATLHVVRNIWEKLGGKKKYRKLPVEGFVCVHLRADQALGELCFFHPLPRKVARLG